MIQSSRLTMARVRDGRIEPLSQPKESYQRGWEYRQAVAALREAEERLEMADLPDLLARTRRVRESVETLAARR